MKNKIVLILILLLAFGLRFWRLGEFPALNADEAAIGYNAYSLIQTGMDEHGNSWPIHFQSFNDYKPGLYFYLVLPFVKFFGLNAWSVRIPGASLGVGTVWVVYLLVKELGRYGRSGGSGKSEKPKMLNTNYQLLASFSAAMLAISPWHIHFSRGGWEVNVATFFITTGVWLFLRWINAFSIPMVSDSKNKILRFAQNENIILVLSVLSLVLSLYAYHAARVVVPLLGLGFAVLFFKELWKEKKQAIKALVVGLIVLLPLVKEMTGPAGLSRAAGVGIFSDIGPFNEINEQRGEHSDLQGIIPRMLHNKPVNYSLAIVENWLEHYHGEFLFLSGDDIQRNKVPEHGQMYLHDALFVMIGVIWLMREIGENKKLGVVALWLLVAPAAAALTFQSPHALRAQNMVIPLVVISAMGLVKILNWFRRMFEKRKFLVIIFQLSIFIVTAWSFMRYQQLYWIYMPRKYPFSSQYGVKELISYVRENQDKYDTIVITDRYDQPYILTLFYLQYPTEKFQSDHELSAPDGYGFSTVRSFDKFRFNSIDWPGTPNEYKNSLIVGTDEEIPEASNIIKTIKFPSGETAFEIVAN